MQRCAEGAPSRSAAANRSTCANALSAELGVLGGKYPTSPRRGACREFTTKRTKNTKLSCKLGDRPGQLGMGERCLLRLRRVSGFQDVVGGEGEEFFELGREAHVGEELDGFGEAAGFEAGEARL